MTGTLLSVIALAFLSQHCTADKRLIYRSRLRAIDVPELGLTVMVPTTWNVTYNNSSFYQLVATGFAPNGYLATLQVRSLANSLRGAGSKALFANGWYQSVRDNNTGWAFLARSQVRSDREGTFQFDGTFTARDPRGDTFKARRLGRLRFRGSRVHAMYYTTADSSMKDTLLFFDTIDNAHKFYPPGKSSGAFLKK